MIHYILGCGLEEMSLEVGSVESMNTLSNRISFCINRFILSELNEATYIRSTQIGYVDHILVTGGLEFVLLFLKEQATYLIMRVYMKLVVGVA